MSIFDLFKKRKVELTEEEQRWNKIWDLWVEEKAESPYQELMTYHSEVMNGGHGQYFTNVENVSDLKKEMKILESVLPENHKMNLKRAYEAYLVLEKKEDEEAEIISEECDEFFFENETDINLILCDYACKVEL